MTRWLADGAEHLVACGGLGFLVAVVFLLVRQHRMSVALTRLGHQFRASHTSLRDKLSTVEKQTCFDALTGFGNAQMFEAKASVLLRGKDPFSLIYVDLDGLKSVNDREGHTAGDRLIGRGAEAIRASVRRRADRINVFRRGSAADEFLIILENARLAAATTLAEKILGALHAASLSASIGVAEWDGVMVRTCAEMELAAEQQMHRAKQEGRDCVRAESVAPRTDSVEPFH
ncbi:MAG TPA: GGDEF domain-containing protein [Pseudomonadota bacterium]|nr:GGDEF domain-containing protein [Pseudomonadota bacterium]